MAVSLNPLGLLIWSNLDQTIEFQDRHNVINKGTFCYKFPSMFADRYGFILEVDGSKQIQWIQIICDCKQRFQMVYL